MKKLSKKLGGTKIVPEVDKSKIDKKSEKIFVKMEVKIMTKRQQNKQQGTSYPAGIKMMISVLPDIFWYCCVNFCHGAPGIAARVNCSSILEDASLLIIVFKTLTGLSERSLAVLMMVINTATLFLPRLVMLPKVILRNKTAFLMPCSAGLFVGGIAGYFRNTKSSSLN